MPFIAYGLAGLVVVIGVWLGLGALVTPLPADSMTAAAGGAAGMAAAGQDAVLWIGGALCIAVTLILLGRIVALLGRLNHLSEEAMGQIDAAGDDLPRPLF
ncbi:hypothetical protein [Rhodospirillum rubrum]|uniref:Uncharacterized protein n=1 Tax=Rhodospirillum rubrum (strain ATCC 11170 / ATH 1.1.1 / DSM 467 / LMG 4362 / NCIMB 8255 / S1) TaxID=269796 RepID=Q2RTY6_RHORT|nr:hypothetical protein [Rhodospirillum rubrum]ABC22409.1 hypothetical protein Rru_A1609 [Rhodospirillum rubrum ATCC 11170]AEO48126.1 hypothetical protein F11_08300 [Rhodospirillum rubrum F11]MBK5953990.1 hypothetical protein [Rhodospirillum rubrum]QXG82045.1 hypothetical protein KUL73_08330 [Rhodospirillum rubrum]HAP99906.1 hypothetical protein [Rhodospirillum rubrum]